MLPAWQRFARNGWLPLLLLVGVIFWRATTLQGIFYFGDIYQLHYPLRVAYANALRSGTLPFWSPDIAAGYPLLAEGQLGALYPPNLLFHLLLDVPWTINATVLFHFVLASWGMYAFARALGLRRAGAYLAGIVYALSGFLIAHLNHLNILSCAAWLPWLFLLTRRCIRGERWTDVLALAVLWALEFLAGHPQIALLSALAVGSYALALPAVERIGKPRRGVLASASALVLGLLLAAPQLLPTYELTTLSSRAGGLDPKFFTSFSLHPAYLATLLSPFLRGNPYPNISVELVGYLGILPLALASLALPLRRDRITRYFVGLALVSLLLAFGRWNPLYAYFLRLPPLNLFRVPARYLYTFTFAGAVLAGLAADRLLARARGTERHRLAAGVALSCALAGIAALALPLEALLTAWRLLPLVWMVAGGAVLFMAWRGALGRRTLAILFLSLALLDLIAFTAVYNRTYNDVMPYQDFIAPPRSLGFFAGQDPSAYRILTHEGIVPVLSVMRESFYPNISIAHGVPSANALFPLLPRAYQDYMAHLTSRMADALGIRYFLIPQLLPVDEDTEFYDLENPLAPSLVGRALDFEPITVTQVEIESYVSHSASVGDGVLAAEVVLRLVDGRERRLPLRVGLETAEWAYDRDDVWENVAHDRPTVARTWPARSGFPPRDHPGHSYLAAITFQEPLVITGVRIEPALPRAFVRVERVRFTTVNGDTVLLSHLVGESDFALVYRSEDVAIYENRDAMPRAYLVHRAEVVASDEEALARLQARDFSPREVVYLLDGEGRPTGPPGSDDVVIVEEYAPMRVSLTTISDADGYLVLADSYYPGWRAYVDGVETPVCRANLMMRAVYVPAGRHAVTFVYKPRMFRLGFVLAGLAVVGMGGVRGVKKLTKRESCAILIL
ncbi:MAG: YfhO family protein [Chloroflexi bacterium]|nr:YfhO family protein [Chloroflexota bacterium]